jgi:hypothetical protein
MKRNDMPAKGGRKMDFKLVRGNSAIPFVVEKEGFEGVRLIAGKVCKDIQLVSGKLPKVEQPKKVKKPTGCVLAATVGQSPILDLYEKGENYFLQLQEMDPEDIDYKRLQAMAQSDVRAREQEIDNELAAAMEEEKQIKEQNMYSQTLKEDMEEITLCVALCFEFEGVSYYKTYKIPVKFL